MFLKSGPPNTLPSDKHTHTHIPLSSTPIIKLLTPIITHTHPPIYPPTHPIHPHTYPPSPTSTSSFSIRSPIHLQAAAQPYATPHPPTCTHNAHIRQPRFQTIQTGGLRYRRHLDGPPEPPILAWSPVTRLDAPTGVT